MSHRRGYLTYFRLMRRTVDEYTCRHLDRHYAEPGTGKDHDRLESGATDDETYDLVVSHSSTCWLLSCSSFSLQNAPLIPSPHICCRSQPSSPQERRVLVRDPSCLQDSRKLRKGPLSRRSDSQCPRSQSSAQKKWMAPITSVPPNRSLSVDGSEHLGSWVSPPIFRPKASRGLWGPILRKELSP